MEGSPWEARLYQLVGRRVRGLREGLKMTQDDLARQINMTRTSVTNVEGGRQKIPLHHLLRIANALGADLRDLIPDRTELQVRKLVSVSIDGEQHEVPPEAANFIKQHIQGTEEQLDARTPKRRTTRPRTA